MRIKKLSAAVGMVAIITGLFLIVACGSKEKDAAVKTDDKPLKVEAAGSQSDADATAVWPADMFPGVPKFTFGKIERVSQGNEGGMTKFNIYLKDMEKGSIERYVELLKEAGWKADISGAAGAGGIVGGEKDYLGLNFMYNTEDGTGMLAVFTVKND
jgi:hypothetical protein